MGKWSPVQRFGVEPGWFAGAPDTDGGFEVFHGGCPVGHLRWELQGEHNRLNALAAVAAAAHAGVQPSHAIAALADFMSVKRRMELRGIARGVSVYDDFAHHPTAIRTTLEGLRRKAGDARILAVLEPRSNTMKLGVMKAALPASVSAADKVFVFGGNLGWDAQDVFAPLGAKAHCASDLGALVEAIANEAQAGDQVLVMSNGGFGGIHEKLLARLAQ